MEALFLLSCVRELVFRPVTRLGDWLYLGRERNRLGRFPCIYGMKGYRIIHSHNLLFGSSAIYSGYINLVEGFMNRLPVLRTTVGVVNIMSNI